MHDLALLVEVVATHGGADEILGGNGLLEVAVEDLDLRVDGDHLELRLVAKPSAAGLGPANDTHADHLDEELLGRELQGLDAAAALAAVVAEAAFAHDVRGEVVLNGTSEAAALALGLQARLPDGTEALQNQGTEGTGKNMSEPGARAHMVEAPLPVCVRSELLCGGARAPT